MTRKRARQNPFPHVLLGQAAAALSVKKGPDKENTNIAVAIFENFGGFRMSSSTGGLLAPKKVARFSEGRRGGGGNVLGENLHSRLASEELPSSYLHAQYDWTTGVPDNGNEWRKFCAVPRLYPLRALVLYFV